MVRMKSCWLGQSLIIWTSNCGLAATPVSEQSGETGGWEVAWLKKVIIKFWFSIGINPKGLNQYY